MSRLDDLITLIRTVNEVYFITAPERVKAAYILVDDILELAFKTFLQEKTFERREQCRAALVSARIISSKGHRKAFSRYCEEKIDVNELCGELGQANPNQLQTVLSSYPDLNHWSANKPESFKEYGDVVDEVKQEFISVPSVLQLLDEALLRHITRNKFYHDHHQAGLTINDAKCLRALCEMFELMEKLFPDFLDKIKFNHDVRCQIGVLRLKSTLEIGQKELSQPYSAALEQIKRGHRYDMDSRSVEHSLVHTVSDRFFRALREQFKNTIAKLQSRIDKIDNMKSPRQEHFDEKLDKQQLIQILQEQLARINTLLSVP